MKCQYEIEKREDEKFIVKNEFYESQSFNSHEEASSWISWLKKPKKITNSKKSTVIVVVNSHHTCPQKEVFHDHAAIHWGL